MVCILVIYYGVFESLIFLFLSLNKGRYMVEVHNHYHQFSRRWKVRQGNLLVSAGYKF
uniref:Uncharacterized protein n=1 Tax=Helianthus annuus TaxID=4232 RepID=A0A251SSX6_HELAN